MAQGRAMKLNYEGLGGNAEKGIYIGYSLGSLQFLVGLAEQEGADPIADSLYIKDIYEKGILLAPCTIMGEYKTEP